MASVVESVRKSSNSALAGSQSKRKIKRHACEATDASNGDIRVCRRSTRASKPPTFFKVLHETRADRETRAAIKRSKVESCQLNVNYSSFVEIPTVFATAEEFKDPVKFWNKYAHLGETYGAVKVVPPSDWRSMCPLDTDRLKFKVREQELRNLCNGKGFSHPSYEWSCELMKEADRQLLVEQFGSENPSVEEVENKYWSIVKEGNSTLVVKYGADLNVYSPEFEQYLVDMTGIPFEKDLWNLKNFPNAPGSLLSYMGGIIPGVNSPWLYIGMCLTSFCWHTEDNYFGAVNYHHWGAPKVWYVVPPGKASSVESVLKNYLASESEEFAVYSLRVQVAPDVLVANGIPVYRTIQREGEFVFAWPRAFHSGFNAGYNCNEACNMAPVSWLPMGYRSLVKYKFNRKTCVSFFTMVMSGVCNYRDFGAEDLSHMIQSLSLLLSQEFDLRSSVNYPLLQMYLHLNTGGSFDIRSFMDGVSASGFDSDAFMNAVTSLCSKNDNDFLKACMVLSSSSMKDCELCDTPTFASCLTCPHCNCTVCISCQSYHPCECSSRIVLYRYPLLAFLRLIKILQRQYLALTGARWVCKPQFTIPPTTVLSDVDSRSLFRVDRLRNTPEATTPTSRCGDRIKWLNSRDPQPKRATWLNLESLSTTDDILSSTSSTDSPISSATDWNPEWFADMRSAVFCSLDRTKPSPMEDESIFGEIELGEPCSLSANIFANASDTRGLATVTKFTLRYLMLALEEDSKESL